MKLSSFFGEQVRIVTPEGFLFNGLVGDYFFSDENETGEESIVIDMANGEAIELYESYIMFIQTE